jgi:hypothetical protein
MMAERARVLLTRPRLLAQKIYRRLSCRRRVIRAARNPIWLYQPNVADAPTLTAEIPGMRVASSWDEIVEAVNREQQGRDRLRVMTYGCAALQWLD